jgi:segregation and condensation protein B
MSELARVVEGLLFLSPDPVNLHALAEACEVSPEDIDWALGELREQFGKGDRGLLLKEVAGGWTLASDPVAEDAARRLLAKPRTPPLSPAQAETLSIVAYLQPVSRPEIARIRGVASDSATATLLERGLIEEHGRSQFGAVLYRTTPLFLKLFGLQSLEALPEVSQWDPTPEEQGALRDRLLRAGDARAGVAAVTTGGVDTDESHHKHHDDAELAAVTSIAPGDDDVPGDDDPDAA